MILPNHLALRAHRPGHTSMPCARHTRTAAPDAAQPCHVAVSPSGTLLADGAAASEAVAPHRTGLPGPNPTSAASTVAPTAGRSNAGHARCIHRRPRGAVGARRAQQQHAGGESCRCDVRIRRELHRVAATRIRLPSRGVAAHSWTSAGLAGPAPPGVSWCLGFRESHVPPLGAWR